MLYTYSPSGHYFIKNALLSPEAIAQLSRQKNNQTQSTVTFSYQDPQTKKRTVLSLSSLQYQAFYQLILEDKNLFDVPPQISKSFNQLPETSLTLTLQKEGDLSSQDFQEIQFLFKGDYYRLRLRESHATNWVYFYHPNIYNEVIPLFIGKHDEN